MAYSTNVENFASRNPYRFKKLDEERRKEAKEAAKERKKKKLKREITSAFSAQTRDLKKIVEKHR